MDKYNLLIGRTFSGMLLWIIIIFTIGYFMGYTIGFFIGTLFGYLISVLGQQLIIGDLGYKGTRKR